MPNICLYSARIRGKAVSVKKLLDWMSASYSYSNWNEDEKNFESLPEPIVTVGEGENAVPTEHHIGYRVFSCYYDKSELEGSKDDDVITVSADGDVAWSVSSTMLGTPSSYYSENKDNPRCRSITLEDACKELSVEVQIFSEECGMGFSEFYHISNTGEFLKNECVDFSEYCIEEYKNYTEMKKAYKKEGWKLNITKEQFKEKKKEGECFISFCEEFEGGREQYSFDF